MRFYVLVYTHSVKTHGFSVKDEVTGKKKARSVWGNLRTKHGRDNQTRGVVLERHIDARTLTWVEPLLVLGHPPEEVTTRRFIPAR